MSRDSKDKFTGKTESGSRVTEKKRITTHLDQCQVFKVESEEMISVETSREI